MANDTYLFRLDACYSSSDNCQTKKETTARRKFNNRQTNKFMYDEY